MKSLIEGLPPEVAQKINPDWCKNEAEYWVQRDHLLSQYHDRWIGFANGQVIVSGSSPVEVFHVAQESELHPFVICVGHENEPCRMRRTAIHNCPSCESHTRYEKSMGRKEPCKTFESQDHGGTAF